MDFGKALAAERRANGMSQHRLALAVDTTQRHLSFLETGRSRPTREMILRLSDALALRPGRRADLFASAGFTSPYRRRLADDKVVLDAIKRLEQFILGPWPYPALALTETWDVLAANPAGRALFGLEGREVGLPNLFDVLASAAFRASISNWHDVAGVVLSRLRRHAAEYAEFRPRLDALVAAGTFAGTGNPPWSDDEPAAILPLAFALPDGRSFRMTSMTARLTSAQDDFIAGLEIEFCIPLDDESDRLMRGEPE